MVKDEISLKDVLEKVLEGIEEASKVGLKIKINCVPLKGVSEKDVLEVLEFCKSRGFVVRFIEFMENFHAKDGAKGLNSDEIKAIISLLNRANGRIKSDVLASTSWYKCPNFTFVNDTSLEKSKHIEDLFAQIRKTKSKLQKWTNSY